MLHLLYVRPLLLPLLDLCIDGCIPLLLLTLSSLFILYMPIAHQPLQLPYQLIGWWISMPPPRATSSPTTTARSGSNLCDGPVHTFPILSLACWPFPFPKICFSDHVTFCRASCTTLIRHRPTLICMPHLRFRQHFSSTCDLRSWTQLMFVIDGLGTPPSAVV